MSSIFLPLDRALFACPPPPLLFALYLFLNRLLTTDREKTQTMERQQTKVSQFSVSARRQQCPSWTSSSIALLHPSTLERGLVDDDDDSSKPFPNCSSTALLQPPSTTMLAPARPAHSLLIIWRLKWIFSLDISFVRPSVTTSWSFLKIPTSSVQIKFYC